ncbi:MAG: hypothetical protein R3C05_18470 [Pirellulaceae bacterium]
MSTDPNAEPLSPEPLMPQWSLRSLMGLTALAAGVMWVLREAFFEGPLWARCVSLVLLSLGGCFFAYAMIFSLATLFAQMSNAILAPFQPRGKQVKQVVESHEKGEV